MPDFLAFDWLRGDLPVEGNLADLQQHELDFQHRAGFTYTVRVAAAAVQELGMSLGAEDTDVMSFEDGFVFLGEDFGPRCPPTLDDPVDVPDHRTLFVGRAGARVRMDGGGSWSNSRTPSC